MSADAPRRYQGQIVEWNDEKRCGFVQPRGTTSPQELVFLPSRSLASRSRSPKVGDVVLFEKSTLEDSTKNRHLRTLVRAENAYFLGEEPLPTTNGYRPPITLAVAYLAALLLASFALPHALWLLIANLALSLLAIAQYGKDKHAAKNNQQRISENALHFVALLGGWPGAAVAQRLFRHKTQKRTFQTAFKITAVLNAVATFGYLFLSSR